MEAGDRSSPKEERGEAMNVRFGKYEGEDVRRLLLQHPDYVKWALKEAKSGQLAALAADIRRYIQDFDTKAFVEQCMGKRTGARCTRPVKCGTAYQRNIGFSVMLYRWCDTCDPHQSGAAATLIPVSTYTEALSIVDRYQGRKSDFTDIIKNLSRAK